MIDLLGCDGTQAPSPPEAPDRPIAGGAWSIAGYLVTPPSLRNSNACRAREVKSFRQLSANFWQVAAWPCGNAPRRAWTGAGRLPRVSGGPNDLILRRLCRLSIRYEDL